MRHTDRSILSAASNLLLAALCVVASATASAKGPPPPQRILLTPLGYGKISARYLLSGATMLTLDYVDNEHLLVTFGVPRLMKRLPDAVPEDEDRIVDAILIELPSGREVARTEWRLHDIGQYLWPLGDGSFLLRRRGLLTTFAPVAMLKTGKPFEQRAFLSFERRVDLIEVSVDRKVLTIETSEKSAPEEDDLFVSLQQQPAQPQGQSAPGVPGLLRRPASPFAAPPAPSPTAEHLKQPRVHIAFVRIIRSASPDRPLVAQFAGRLDVRKNIVVPMTSEGFLRTRDQTAVGVQLDFATFTGKITDLGPFDSSCSPSPSFVSPSEFVAFGCRGADDRLQLAGFNLHGDLMWQLNFSDIQAYPSLVSSAAAGRFALSRTVTRTHVFGSEIPSTDQISFQEVRVFQTYNGRQLLRVFTSPEQRAGQNFSLSPDGLSLAVIHDPTDPNAAPELHKPSIEIYRLPPLSPADEQHLKAEAALAPPPFEGPIRFSAGEVKSALADAVPEETTIETNPAAAQLPDSAAVRALADGSDPSAPRAVYGDLPSNGHRPRPTLYTLPTDPEAPPDPGAAKTPSSGEPVPH